MADMDTEVGPHDEFLAEKADAIRQLARNIVHDVVEIGRHLTEAKSTVRAWTMAGVGQNTN